jgi:hypothetical protein
MVGASHEVGGVRHLEGRRVRIERVVGGLLELCPSRYDPRCAQGRRIRGLCQLCYLATRRWLCQAPGRTWAALERAGRAARPKRPARRTDQKSPSDQGSNSKKS